MFNAFKAILEIISKRFKEKADANLKGDPLKQPSYPGEWKFVQK